MGNKFDREPDPCNEYNCSPGTKSIKFTNIMHMVNNISQLNYRYVENYIRMHVNTINNRNDKEWTALMIAARNSKTTSNEYCVQLLLNFKADPNLKNNHGWTALMMAARYSKTVNTVAPQLLAEPTVASQLLAEPTVQMLLANKADPNLKNNDGWTALMMAARHSKTTSNEYCVQLLLNFKADPNLKQNDGWTALMMAAECSKTKSTENTVQMLLANKADPNLKQNDGCTALMMAAQHSETTSTENTVALQLLVEPTVQMLLANKADPNLKQNDGCTALMMVAACSRTDSTENTVAPQLLVEPTVAPQLLVEPTVQMLLANKADPNLKQNDGCTALMIAAKNFNTNSSINTIRVLLDYGADPNLTNGSILEYTNDIDIIKKSCKNGLVVTVDMIKYITNNNIKDMLVDRMIEYESNKRKYKKIIKSITTEYIAHFRNKPGSLVNKLAEINYGLLAGTININTILDNKILIYLLSIHNRDDIINKLNLFLYYE